MLRVLSIGKSGFHNKTRNPFSDFDEQKSCFETDFVEQWEIEIRISQSKAPYICDLNFIHLGPYRTGTCFVYFTFEICHQLKCCSAIGLVGVLVKFLRTSLLQRFRMVLPRGRTFGKTSWRNKRSCQFLSYQAIRTAALRFGFSWRSLRSLLENLGDQEYAAAGGGSRNIVDGAVIRVAESRRAMRL